MLTNIGIYNVSLVSFITQLMIKNIRQYELLDLINYVWPSKSNNTAQQDNLFERLAQIDHILQHDKCFKKILQSLRFDSNHIVDDDPNSFGATNMLSTRNTSQSLLLQFLILNNQHRAITRRYIRHIFRRFCCCEKVGQENIIGQTNHNIIHQQRFSQYKFCELWHYLRLLLFIAQILQEKPIGKIIGFQYFCDQKFLVNNNTLLPRQSTELLVSTVCQYVKRFHLRYLFELGVGTGCVTLSVLKECNNSIAVGIDCSHKALMIAKINAQLMQQTRCLFWHSDWKNITTMQCDLIFSNPPYINKQDMVSLAQTVGKHDPHTALFGGQDGLVCYREIAKLFHKLDKINHGKCYNIRIKKRIYCIVEIGYGQRNDVINIFHSTNYWKLTEEIYDGICIRILCFHNR